tara:strand:- start:109196 stop:110518 length:1323 start_codon:yes stop_codon:yes gene_type:complete
MKHKRVKGSLEALAQQSDRFFRDLTTKAAALKGEFVDGKIQSNSQYHAFMKYLDIDSLVRKATGMNVKFTVYSSPYENAYCTVPNIKRNHVLNNNFLRTATDTSDINKILSDAKNDYNTLKGSIDHRNCKVSGFYSKVPFEIGVASAKLYNKPPEQIAATWLHELGHAWYYLAFLHCTLASNFYMGAIRQARTGEDITKVVTYLADEDLLRYANIDIDSLSEKLDDEVEIKIYSSLFQCVQADINADVYALSASEQMADEFVSKHGASLHQARNMTSYYEDESRNKASTHYINALLDIRNTVGAILGVGIAFVIPQFIGYSIIVGVITAMGSWLNSDVGSQVNGYDRPRERMDKLYQGAIQRSRDPKISKEEKQSLVKTIREIDSIRKEYKDYWEYGTIFWSLFSASKRHTLQSRTMQLNIEKLASNSLFQYSNELLHGD